MEYKVSASRLNLLENCPRCFWLAVIKNVKRPVIPMASILNRMDAVIKNYYNEYRVRNELPPILNNQINGRLAVNMPVTLQCRTENGLILMGRPDEYLKKEDCSIAILDHKTTGKPPERIHPSYYTQLNVYNFLLKMSGYKTSNKSYIAFYCPGESNLDNGMIIHCTVHEIIADSTQVKNLLNKAYKVLREPMPDAGENCEFCKWAQAMSDNYLTPEVKL